MTLREESNTWQAFVSAGERGREGGSPSGGLRASLRSWWLRPVGPGRPLPLRDRADLHVLLAEPQSQKGGSLRGLLPQRREAPCRLGPEAHTA